MAESAVLAEYGVFVRKVFDRLRYIARIECSEALREPIEYQFSTLEHSKGVRPALVAAAARMSNLKIANLVDRAAAIQAIHEFTLIIDDILDDSPMRRGKQSLRTVFDPVVAGCAAAELESLASMIFDDDVELRRELRWFKRAVASAEAMQQNDRYTARPYPIPSWQSIARGDTGSLFELSLCAGGIFARGSEMLDSLAYLRHGLDDIDDLFDEGGDQADVRDSIPTLPTCFTDSQTLSGLQNACCDALRWLQPRLNSYRTIGHNCRFEDPIKPFFDDFAAVWQGLSEASKRQCPLRCWN